MSGGRQFWIGGVADDTDARGRLVIRANKAETPNQGEVSQ